MSTTATPYTEHIRRAFIDPIRSVLAIDDEYPTIDHILACDEDQLKNLARNENWHRLEKLVRFCRSRSQELLIDVHDGSGEDLAHGLPLKSLRQCDWVVLDYQLNGVGGDGTRSCEILSRLAASEYFNLVTIYTQKPIDEVFKEVSLKFSQPLSTELLPDPASTGSPSFLDEWSDSDPDIEDKLVGTVSSDVYLRLLERGHWTIKPKPSCTEILGDFLTLYKERPENFLVPKADLLAWTIRRFEEKNGLHAAPPRQRHTAKAKLDDQLKWMFVGNLFVSFIEKDVEPENLLAKTLDCLAAWNPSPNRLALSKLRAELEASGILADNDVMDDRLLQAYWLSKLLGVEQWELREHIGALVSRQTELLFEKLRAKVASYTGDVISSIDRSDIGAAVATFFPEITNSKDGVLAHNAMVSTRPVGGGNLIPGHILKLEISAESFELWICLSPACDLVPCRTTGRDLKTRLKGWLPFTAAKLFKISKPDSLSKANQGHVVFIRHNGVLEQYSIYYKGSLSSNPVWEEFFAKNEGVFEPDTPLLTIAQLQSIELELPKPAPEMGQEEITGAETKENFKIFESRIVAQLRAEYAFNLSQKLSSHLTRVGLEYSDK